MAKGRRRVSVEGCKALRSHRQVVVVPTHGVFFVKKSGELYKNPTKTFSNERDALRCAAYLMKLNPGKEARVNVL
jgi:hypothetical protein